MTCARRFAVSWTSSAQQTDQSAASTVRVSGSHRGHRARTPPQRRVPRPGRAHPAHAPPGTGSSGAAGAHGELRRGRRPGRPRDRAASGGRPRSGRQPPPWHPAWTSRPRPTDAAGSCASAIAGRSRCASGRAHRTGLPALDRPRPPRTSPSSSRSAWTASHSTTRSKASHRPTGGTLERGSW